MMAAMKTQMIQGKGQLNTSSRLTSIDALRGLVILFMLLDHVRETFFLHYQVSDPMDIFSTSLGLFCNRTLAHICAPVFIFLSGLSSYLYGEKHNGTKDTTQFLLKRGIFLIILELTLVNFAWTFQFPPTVIYLQVIWAIGLSMIALSLLIFLPRWVLIGLGFLIICTHNLLDGVHFDAESPMYIPWAILHDRSWFSLGEILKMRTSYPVLPWIGVICLGYATGPWFGKNTNAHARHQKLLRWGCIALGIFFTLRFMNIYGEKPRIISENAVQTVMSFFNVTKYPPSFLFICFTLGIGLLLLLAFEKLPQRKWISTLSVFGAVPMFFYLLHLYVLKFLYLGALAIWGTNQGQYFGFDSVAQVWLCTIILAVALYPAAQWFGRLKAQRKDLTWLKYF